MTRKSLHAGALILLVLAASAARGSAAPDPSASRPALPLVEKVDAQPLLSQVQRVIAALDFLGAPLADSTKAALDKAAQESDPAQAVREAQQALDPYCLMGV